jgi:hypothetical protein
MTDPEKKPVLSTELKVACEIYRYNLAKKPIWFTKLVEVFDGVISKQDISHALDTCTDWMIIHGHYDNLENGRAGYVYEIDLNSGGHGIPDLYEKYWKNQELKQV